MWASLRSRVMTATSVTRFAFSRKGSTIPAMSKISSVRGKIAKAFECSDCDERSSISRHCKFLRAHSFARNRPTGPAPTINMPVSVSLSGMSDFLCWLDEGGLSAAAQIQVDGKSLYSHLRRPDVTERILLL